MIEKIRKEGASEIRTPFDNKDSVFFDEAIFIYHKMNQYLLAK